MKFNLPCKILIIDGLDFFSKKSNPIDILLLDINMPFLDGWQFLDGMKKSNIKKPVFMLSSTINPKDIERALNYNDVIAFWSKPLNFNTLENYL